MKRGYWKKLDVGEEWVPPCSEEFPWWFIVAIACACIITFCVVAFT